MNTLIINLKREFWEYKRIVVGLPLLLTGLFFLMAILGTTLKDMKGLKEVDNVSYSVEIGEDSDEDKSTNLAVEGVKEPSSDGMQITVTPNAPSKEPQDQESDESEENDARIWFTGVYLALAWLGALFYCFSSLYNDRRDRSVFYWKSMPVSETKTVLAKYLFAVLGFSIAAWLLSLIAGVVLALIAHVAVDPDQLSVEDPFGFNAARMVVWPILVILLNLVWCLPFFGFALLVSARAKRWPIGQFFLALLLALLLEKIIFKSSIIYSFITSHSPFSLLSDFSEYESFGQAFNAVFVTDFASLVLGALVGIGFLYAAIWHRNNRFEIEA